MLPVVQPRSFDVFAVQLKAKRLDQVQKRPGGHTRTADVACIPVDLGRHQYDVALYRFNFGFGEVFFHLCNDLNTSNSVHKLMG